MSQGWEFKVKKPSKLTTGHTPKPLNPGLHSVPFNAPWDSSRVVLTALVLWLDSRHGQSLVVRDNVLLPCFNQDHKCISEREREGECLCVPVSSGVYGSLTHSC